MECESDRYTNHDVWSVRMEYENDRYSNHDVWDVRVNTTVTMTYGV